MTKTKNKLPNLFCVQEGTLYVKVTSIMPMIRAVAEGIAYTTFGNSSVYFMLVSDALDWLGKEEATGELSDSQVKSLRMKMDALENAQKMEVGP